MWAAPSDATRGTFPLPQRPPAPGAAATSLSYEHLSSIVGWVECGAEKGVPAEPPVPTGHAEHQEHLANILDWVHEPKAKELKVKEVEIQEASPSLDSSTGGQRVEIAGDVSLVSPVAGEELFQSLVATLREAVPAEVTEVEATSCCVAATCFVDYMPVTIKMRVEGTPPPSRCSSLGISNDGESCRVVFQDMRRSDVVLFRRACNQIAAALQEAGCLDEKEIETALSASGCCDLLLDLDDDDLEDELTEMVDFMKSDLHEALSGEPGEHREELALLAKQVATSPTVCTALAQGICVEAMLSFLEHDGRSTEELYPMAAILRCFVQQGCAEWKLASDDLRNRLKKLTLATSCPTIVSRELAALLRPLAEKGPAA